MDKFQQFIQARRFFKNVTAKTLAWYNCSFIALQKFHGEKSTQSKAFGPSGSPSETAESRPFRATHIAGRSTHTYDGCTRKATRPNFFAFLG